MLSYSTNIIASDRNIYIFSAGVVGRSKQWANDPQSNDPQLLIKERSAITTYFKIINNIYDASSVPTLPLDTSSVTRGNSFKLSNLHFYHSIRKYAFVPRIINIWNSLPDFVVKVDSINVFKKRLDKSSHIKISCLITQLKLPESEIDRSWQLILIWVKSCVYIYDTDTEALQCLHPSLRWLIDWLIIQSDQ